MPAGLILFIRIYLTALLTICATIWEEKIPCICEYCGKQYQISSLMKARSRFCSNKCRTAYRYRTGLDNIEKVCPICGKPFTINKYSRTKTCSKECGVKMASRTKTEAHRQKK